MMKRFLVLLAAAIPVAATIGLAAISAGPSVAAQAADTCHNQGLWEDFATTTPQYWDVTQGQPYAVNEYVNTTTSAISQQWCQAAGISSSYVLFRLKGTSFCATYFGPATGSPSGAGSGVYLQTCDVNTLSQNWNVSVWHTETGGNGLTTQYNTAGTCLSADKASSTDPGPALVMVDNCSGVGGQIWGYGT
jgi:hypothetical protein